jgi:uncharacterized membrane protein
VSVISGGFEMFVCFTILGAIVAILVIDFIHLLLFRSIIRNTDPWPDEDWISNPNKNGS